MRCTLMTTGRYGCGNSIHLKCMKIWADHQKSTGATMIRCPLCREDFGSLDVSIINSLMLWSQLCKFVFPLSITTTILYEIHSSRSQVANIVQGEASYYICHETLTRSCIYYTKEAPVLQVFYCRSVNTSLKFNAMSLFKCVLPFSRILWSLCASYLWDIPNVIALCVNLSHVCVCVCMRVLSKTMCGTIGHEQDI